MQAASAIQGAAISQALRDIVVKVGDSTATVADINASNISLSEKSLLRGVLAGTATRVDVGVSALDMQLKALILASPAGQALAGNAAAVTVGTVAAA